MKLWQKIVLSLGIISGLSYGAIAFGAILQGYQGGTGFGPTVPTSTAGYYLQVASTSPWLTYTLSPVSGGSSSTVNLTGSSTAFFFPYWLNTNGGLSTSSPIFVSSSTGGLGFGTTTIPVGYYFNEVASDTNGNYFDLQNNNASSYSEFGLTADNGSTSTFYGGLGINNSAGAKGIENNDDLFLEATNGINYESCVTGNSSNCLHSFFIGGTAAGNLKFQISSTSITANVTTTLATTTISSLALGGDTTGDMYYRNSSGLLTRLGIGASGAIISSNGTLPTWQTTPLTAAQGGTATTTALGTAAFTATSSYLPAASSTYFPSIATTTKGIFDTAPSTSTPDIMFYTETGFTIKQFDCVNSPVAGNSVYVNIGVSSTVNISTGTLMTAPFLCNSTSTIKSTTTFANAVVPANSIIQAFFSGTPSSTGLYVDFKF